MKALQATDYFTQEVVELLWEKSSLVNKSYLEKVVQTNSEKKNQIDNVHVI